MEELYDKRKLQLPLVEEGIQACYRQIHDGNYFLFENPAPSGTVPRHLPSEALGTMGFRQLPNLHMGGARDCQRRSTENDHGRPHSKLTLSIRIRDAFRVRIPEGGRKPKMGKGNDVRTPEFEPLRAKRVLRAGDSLGKGNLLCSTQCARGFLVTKLFHL